MSTRLSSAVVVILARAPLFAILALPLAAQSVDRLVGKNVAIAQTNYKGQSAIQVIAKAEAANATSYALVKDVSFRDGVIEVDLAGQPASSAFTGAWVHWHRFSDSGRRALRVHLSQTHERPGRRSSQAEPLHAIQFVSGF
jgi:hypothetical protein